MRVAAVDCGTNSFRLLIAEATRTFDRRIQVTGLGRGVDATGRLDPDAIARSVAVLEQYGQAIRDAGCDRVRMVATSAARDAANFDDFRVPAAAAIGVEPEIITGEEEAALSFEGATVGLPRADGPVLVVDVGGGSTEFVMGDRAGPPTGAWSADIGSRRITEKYLHHDPPLPDELWEGFAFVDSHLGEVEAALPVMEARRLVGVAGTITTLAASLLGLDTYDPSRTHHFEIVPAELEDLFRRLSAETVDERKADPAIDPARADVIVGGALIVVAILRRWPFARLLVSESDILDGIAARLANHLPRRPT